MNIKIHFWFSVTNMCPLNWSQYSGNCYQFRTSDSGDYIRWTDAERSCTTEGAHLVSILDVDEMQFLHYKLVTDWLTEENKTYIGNLKLKFIIQQKYKN